MAHARAANPSVDAPPAAHAGRRRTLALGLLGSLLCYLAHPPVGWSLLAWIGPTPWLYLCRLPQLPGRRPYLALWLAGGAFWLAAIQWIRLPYPANIVFLVLMAIYLGAYLPVFVGLTRVGVHRLHLPLSLVGAVVWTGLEWLRARLLTGFLMASLAHTQVKNTLIIQIADLGGEYAVTFLIVLVAGAIAAALPLPREPGRPRPRRVALAPLRLAPAAIALALAAGYGYQIVSWDAARMVPPGGDPNDPRIAIIQTNMLADWKGTPERDARAMTDQFEQSLAAVRDSDKPVDLIVWPETMFRQQLLERDPNNLPPRGAIRESTFSAAEKILRALVEQTGAAVLVGIDRVLVSAPDEPGATPNYRLQVYNSAVFMDRNGRLVGTYDKMHLLPFGEFIPFQGWFPFLEKYSPISGNSLWGARPAAFELDDAWYAPNICYETVLPHVIRRQFHEAVDSVYPDVLVNLTNDAWYWGSSELDMHLASGVFRAVEMRRPLVIAANRGLSAYITRTGRIAAVTERDRADVLLVDVDLPVHQSRSTPYATYGDWLSLTCLAGCVTLAAVGIHWRRALRSADSASRLNSP